MFFGVILKGLCSLDCKQIFIASYQILNSQAPPWGLFLFVDISQCQLIGAQSWDLLHNVLQKILGMHLYQYAP
jgi:hypothetical protein